MSFRIRPLFGVKPQDVEHKVIVEECPLDDRDQGSQNSDSQPKKHDFDRTLSQSERVASHHMSYGEETFTGKESNNMLPSETHKTRRKHSHRHHRRTKSTPNNIPLFTLPEANHIGNDNYLSQFIPDRKKSRRVRAISFAQYTRQHYGALDNITEDEELDISNDHTVNPTKDKGFKGDWHVQPDFPHLAHPDMFPANHLYIDNTVSSNEFKGQCYPNEHDHGRSHRRQHSIEQVMERFKGSDQSLRLRDSLFSLVFLIHIILLIWIGIKYGSEALVEKSVDVDKQKINKNIWVVEGTDLMITYRNVIALACLCGISSMSLSVFAFLFMTTFTTCLIQVALCLAIAFGFTWGIVGLVLVPKNFVPISGIFALSLTIAYTFVVWDRIPLASTKLKIGLAALQQKRGVMLLTFLVQTLFLLWTIYFTYATIGLYDALQDYVIPSTKQWRIFCYISLAVSYFWVFQIAIVTVAGVVKDWWFNKDASPTESLWTKAPIRSFLRAFFFSFGSVCLGSLLVGVMETFRQFADCIRPKQDFLPCGHNCLSAYERIISSVLRYIGSIFNQWAFTYIGLYGYSFITAGKQATNVLHKRGWINIVNDDLIPNILLMVSLFIGGTTGCFAVLIENTDGSNLTTMTNPSLTAFLIGFSIGSMLSSILFSIIKSSVDAVIICFAESPFEFEKNHKELAHELRSEWKNVWPGSVDLVFDRSIRGIVPLSLSTL